MIALNFEEFYGKVRFQAQKDGSWLWSEPKLFTENNLKLLSTDIKSIKLIPLKNESAIKIAGVPSFSSAILKVR